MYCQRGATRRILRENRTMHDPNRLFKWLFVLGLVVLALLVLYPPTEKLKGGIDLVGGTSLLFEIDTTGLDPIQQQGLSTRVMRILRERVDPNQQLNLEWRPVGNTRIEIRMPHPPREAFERRERFDEAVDRLSALNVSKRSTESALNVPKEQRQSLVDELARGVSERKPLLAALVAAHDAYLEVSEADDVALVESAKEEYEKAMADVLLTNFPVSRFTDILALATGKKRDAELEKLRTEYPSYDRGGEADPNGKLMAKAVAAHDEWAKDKAELEDPSDLKRRLRGAGVLEFIILADRDPSSPQHTVVENNPQLRQAIDGYVEQLQRYGPRSKAGDRYRWLPVDNVVSFMHLDDIKDYETQKTNPSQPIVEVYAGHYYVLAHNGPEYGLLQGTGRKGWSLRSAYADQDPMTGRNIVLFRLDPRGGQQFGELTGNNISRNLCIVLDGTAMSHAVIQSRITEAGQITGDFTLEKVYDLVRTLEAGSLPARLKETPLSENTIGPSLGETNRTKGMNAAIWGTILVAVFIFLYYGIWAGTMADIALALNLLFVLSIMALMQATFTLPGIAGLILTVGMAIDANVLIFERVREERDRGVIFKKALNAGYQKAFSTIMDANLTTLITCVILGFVGSEEIKGFAITLGIGISTSLFTALFVTRLVFNTLIAGGILKDFSMRRIVGVPTVDWLALRRIFWPVSTIAVVLGLGLFVWQSTTRTEAMYDIEFLGGTSLRVDLKPGVQMTDEEMAVAIMGDGGERDSAVDWLRASADQLVAAEAAVGDVPGQFTLESPELTGDQLIALMRKTIEPSVERGGMRSEGHRAIFDGKPGQLSLTSFRDAVANAKKEVLEAAARLHGARVQSVGELEPVAGKGLSYEIVTIETNRELVQAAILGTLGDRLSVQRALTFTRRTDEELTREPFFVVEGGEPGEPGDHFLADVIGGDSTYDVRPFRGGIAVVVDLDPAEELVTVAEIERRLREVGLQPEFEQFRTRESAVLPLGVGSTRSDGETGYRQFAVLAIDESLLYDDDPVLWTEQLARTHLAQVQAALGQEKSLSKVIQFAPQVAGQTKNKTMFALVLALGAIVSYLWLRFGTKEYGLAAIVALVHDVGITLGLVGFCQYVAGTFFGDALLLDPFRVDLPMIAAVLTVIGYSLNDTIVVFDRIRENRGRVESLNPRVINNSINQTLARTLLTSFTTFVVILVLYIFGGKGVHGFSFALLIGIVVGTYSSIGIATPLLYRPVLLAAIVTIMVALGLIGIVFAAVSDPTWRWIWIVLTVIATAGVLFRSQREAGYLPGARPAQA